MTSFEMYQEFQVYMDSIDSQDLPEYEPEQVFILLNLAVDEYVQAIRQAFESNSKIGDDAISLIKRIYINPELEGDRIKFDYNKANYTEHGNTFYPIYYLLNGRFKSGYVKNRVEISTGYTDINFVQQDDIVPALSDPFNKPRFADRVPCVRENSAIYATPPTSLQLHILVGTAIIKPAIISQNTNCDLREQVHKTIVKRSTELALEAVGSPRAKTFNS